MQLQLAVDLFNDPHIDKAIDLIDQVRDYIDIIEMDGVLIEEGPGCLKVIKDRYPEKIVYADPKTLYAGRAEVYYRNGADCVTLSCLASDDDYKAAVNYAHSHGKIVASDFCIVEKVGIAERMVQMDHLGVDIVSFGVSVDYALEGANYDNPTALLISKHLLKSAKRSVMGGVTVDNIEKLAKHKPDIIVAGRGIYDTENPREAARMMKEIMNKYDN